MRVRSAQQVIAAYEAAGKTPTAALSQARAQVAGLLEHIADDERWSHLVRLARDVGDPWNADDWPLGFDAMVLVVSQCTHVAFECARCPVGQRQAKNSCAHPTTLVGQIGDAVRRGDRSAARRLLSALDDVLAEAATHA